MIKWNLRKVMADKGIWNGQELVRLLEERAGIILSHNAVMNLIKHQPKAVRFTTLEALCQALDVGPWELISYVPEKSKRKQNAVGDGNGPIAPYKRNKQDVPTKFYPEEEF